METETLGPRPASVLAAANASHSLIEACVRCVDLFWEQTVGKFPLVNFLTPRIILVLEMSFPRQCRLGHSNLNVHCLVLYGHSTTDCLGHTHIRTTIAAPASTPRLSPCVTMLWVPHRCRHDERVSHDTTSASQVPPESPALLLAPRPPPGRYPHI